MHYKAPNLANKHTCLYSPLLKDFFKKCMLCFLKIYFKLILETISDKNCTNRTACPIIQGWLQVYVFIPGRQYLA